LLLQQRERGRNNTPNLRIASFVRRLAFWQRLSIPRLHPSKPPPILRVISPSCHHQPCYCVPTLNIRKRERGPRLEDVESLISSTSSSTQNPIQTETPKLNLHSFSCTRLSSVYRRLPPRLSGSASLALFAGNGDGEETGREERVESSERRINSPAVIHQHKCRTTALDFGGPPSSPLQDTNDSRPTPSVPLLSQHPTPTTIVTRPRARTA
jgi:hypothetical protein